jgi:pimeloyl-ACP methyl ester carboxylesterase
MLGYGTNKSSRSCGINEQADHFLHIANAAFGRERNFVLIGHSIGGMVAHEIARRFPQRVSRVYSIEGNLTKADAFWTGAIARNGAYEVVAKLPERNSPSAARSWMKTLDLTQSTANRKLVNNWINRQTTPTLVKMSKSVYYWPYSSHLNSCRQQFQAGILRFVAGENSLRNWSGLKSIGGGDKSVILVPRTRHMVMEREDVLSEIISKNLLE